MYVNCEKDKRVVVTLDAGGTNFVFSAVQGNREIITPIVKPSFANDQERCLNGIVKGFEEVFSLVPQQVSAISFAFPGPADYDKGIIGDLPNFKAFNGDVILGPLLEDHFDVPVFINNDGNLFALGEALTGFMPDINDKLKKCGSNKQYNNLIGLTIGTGFGCGIVIGDILLKGDNSCGGEIHNTLNKNRPDWNAEKSVSSRAIQRIYAQYASLELSAAPMPKDIYDIAKGLKAGDEYAALQAFTDFGEALGSSVCNVLTIVDGLVVIGGGLAGAWDLFAPHMFREVNNKYLSVADGPVNRLSMKVFNLEDPFDLNDFCTGAMKEKQVPNSNRKITYDAFARTGIGRSKNETSRSISLGAYAYALVRLGF